MQSDEIVLASFPYGGSAGMKLRPVLLLTGSVGSIPEFLVAYISSVMPSVALPTDLVLDPTLPAHASTNLKALSVVRLHKLPTIHGRNIVRKLGTRPPQVATEVDDRLRTFLGL